MPVLTQPRKTIALTAYYDASANTTENDFADFSSVVSEDFYFNTATRVIALGRLRRALRQRDAPHPQGG